MISLVSETEKGREKILGLFLCGGIQVLITLVSLISLLLEITSQFHHDG